MTDRYEPPEDGGRPMEFTPAPRFGHMKPFWCEYQKDGVPYGIPLYGTDECQVLEDNCDTLPGLKVLGVLDSTAPARPDDTEGS